MMRAGQRDIDNVILDLMTYQAFVAGLTHIPEMMEGEGLTFQECLLRVLVETCESELAFAGISRPGDGLVRTFASHPNPLPLALPEAIDSPVLRAALEQERCEVVEDTTRPGKKIAPGIRCALVVPYRNRGARCVVCVCNRSPDSFARPDLGLPYVSHEVKMAQALMELRPI